MFRIACRSILEGLFCVYGVTITVKLYFQPRHSTFYVLYSLNFYFFESPNCRESRAACAFAEYFFSTEFKQKKFHFFPYLFDTYCGQFDRNRNKHGCKKQ